MKNWNISFRRSAVVSGLSLMLMAILAGLANFTVVEKIASGLAAGDSGTILASMAVSGRWAVPALAGVAVLDVIVAWSLFVMFRPDQPALSLLTAWFRLVYTVVFIVSIVYLYSAFRLAGTDSVSAVRTFALFDSIWMTGLLFFGIHLVLLGVMAVRSSRIHWIFGVLLLAAGIGYGADTVIELAVPEADPSIGLYTFIGEMVFMVWLLVRGLSGGRKTD